MCLLLATLCPIFSSPSRWRGMVTFLLRWQYSSFPHANLERLEEAEEATFHRKGFCSVLGICEEAVDKFPLKGS